MNYFPIFAQLTNKPVLIVGGGDVALRKAKMLLKAGAQLTLVAPNFSSLIKELSRETSIELVEESFQAHHLDNKMLVISATDDDQINQQVSQLANERNIFVNVVDNQPQCSFIFPSIVDRSPVTIAISSGGHAPVLARRLREKLETLIPQHTGELAALVGQFRQRVKDTFKHFSDRRLFWESVFDSHIERLIQRGKITQAHEELTRQLQEHAPPKGEVFIIGAGPGDPELLTLKALQLIQQADVVAYDYLVSNEIMELVRRDAELICVGKRLGEHSKTQEETNLLLIELAKKGKKVCRLKGGDPFIYGRGGEEAQQLVAANIAYQIIPGITAAAGCSAYAGIPLTHRDHAQAVQFVTGHHQKDGRALNWPSLAAPNQTLAIYMGVLKSPYIQEQLIHHGRSPNTPVAIIENGTRKNQRVVTGELKQLASLIEQHNIVSPSLLIIGEVAALHDSLAWFGE